MAMGGMGALPFDGGSGFRVWAPHARAVSVTGDFNGWSGEATWLAPEGDGYWYGEAAGAQLGQRYKYVIHTDEWGVFDKIDPYALAVTNSVGDGIIYDHGWFDWQYQDDFACPPHHELVIQEIHVGTYTGGWEGAVGTFDSIVDKLGHFEYLGVNAIQLMPIMEFAGDRSWGYNPAHPFAVESAYGGPDGLKTLVREAHKRGIAVILDVVYNHFGPSDLAIWQFDGWNENGKGGIYFYNDDRSWTPWGDTRPDYGRAEVRRYIRDNAHMWLADYKVDGLRFDMTPFIRSVDGDADDDLPDGWAMIREINEELRAAFPDAILIAEDLQDDPSVTEQHGGAFNSQWDAGFVHPVRRALVALDDGERSVTALAGAVTHVSDNVLRRVVYTDNHDEAANGHQRLPSEIAPIDTRGFHALKRSALGAALVLTSPGIPMLFQGQEFAQDGPFTDDHPLDWWRNDELAGFVQLHRDLIALRRNFSDDSRGLRGHGVAVLQADEETKVLVYHRWENGGSGDDVVVAMNVSGAHRGDHPIPMPHAGRWRMRVNGDAAHYSPLFTDADAFDLDAWEGSDDGAPAHAIVTLAPYSFVVLSRA